MLPGGFEPPLAFTEEIYTFGTASKAMTAYLSFELGRHGQAWARLEKRLEKRIHVAPPCHLEDLNLREPSQMQVYWLHFWGSLQGHDGLFGLIAG
jgi:hypothetical protein